jgi:hypothetical protein
MTTGLILAGSAPQSPVGAFAPGTPGSGAATAALQAGGVGAGGGQGPDADQLIPAFGATPARPRRPVSTPSPTPISRKKLAMDSAASQLVGVRSHTTTLTPPCEQLHKRPDARLTCCIGASLQHLRPNGS